MKIAVPAKTFVAGEYLTLLDGPALVATTAPLFTLQVDNKPFDGGDSLEKVLHSASPAGKFFAQHPQLSTQPLYMSRQEPYASQGGFGGSTADYIALLEYAEHAQNQDLSIWDEWSLYRKLANAKASAVPPSGADLVAQLAGGLVYTHPSQNKLSTWNAWPFDDFDLVIVKTQQKVATHEHLAELDVNSIPQAALQTHFDTLLTGIESASSQQFIAGFRDYGACLRKAGFCCNESLELLANIERITGVLAAKGCGALGADTLAICIANKYKDDVITQLEQQFTVLIPLSSNLAPLRKNFAV